MYQSGYTTVFRLFVKARAVTLDLNRNVTLGMSSTMFFELVISVSFCFNAVMGCSVIVSVLIAKFEGNKFVLSTICLLCHVPAARDGGEKE